MLARWAQLVRVTSLGEGSGAGATCEDSFVFPRVSHVRAWIDDHMKNTQFCKFAGNSDQPINKWNECATKQAEGWKVTWYLISLHPISNTEELDRWLIIGFDHATYNGLTFELIKSYFPTKYIVSTWWYLLRLEDDLWFNHFHHERMKLKKHIKLWIVNYKKKTFQECRNIDSKFSKWKM